MEKYIISIIRKENSKNNGQISKETMEDQKMLVIIMEDLVILGKIVLIIIIIIITKTMEQSK